MTITITPDPTLEEVVEKATTLYHLQRVNFEAADEIEEAVRPLWDRLPKNARLRDVVVGESRDHSFNRIWDNTVSETWFTKTASLSPLLKEGCWPNFEYGNEDKQDLINLWTELIGASDEAGRIAEAISATGRGLNSLLFVAERGHSAQELRGWYARVSTGRRDATGWIVSGRGQTIHVLPDPLAGVLRISPSTYHHTRRITDEQVANVLASSSASDFIDGNTIRFTLKASTVNLLQPPDMASDRKVWTRGLVRVLLENRAEGTRVWEEYVRWKMEAREALNKKKNFEDWKSNLPEAFGPEWLHSLRWATGAQEAFLTLRRVSGISDEDLLKGMEEDYFLTFPDRVLTEADQAILATRPEHGSDNHARTLGKVIASKAKDLAPLF
jgi:hypothetical protein